MFEAEYSLFQLIGISSVLFLTGMSFGIVMGKSVQRKRDWENWGPGSPGRNRRRR